MEFRRYVSHAAPYEVTGRKVAAYRRKLVADRARLPLFADLIAERQLSPEQEMARRVAFDWQAEEQARRDARAAAWRKIRARYFALPPKIRAAVSSEWRGHRWMPKEPVNLSSVIWSAGRGILVSAEDMPDMPAALRNNLAGRLNDGARTANPWSRTKRVYSPGAMAWLAPGFEPNEDRDRPHPHLDVSRGRWSLLFDAIAGFDAFGHNSDPSGERRAGQLEVFGTGFRFEVLTVQAGSDAPCDVTWNGDVARRFLWIGLADELVDLPSATFASI